VEGQVADEAMFKRVKYPTLALCARDDVLFEHLEKVKRMREGDDSVKVGVVGGARFSVDRDELHTWTSTIDFTMSAILYISTDGVAFRTSMKQQTFYLSRVRVQTNLSRSRV
jgi:hypothetical protein